MKEKENEKQKTASTATTEATATTAQEEKARKKALKEAQKQAKKQEKEKISFAKLICDKLRKDRIGVNATLRLLYDYVEEKDSDCLNTIANLCNITKEDVCTLEKETLFSLIKNAVNNFYPYYAKLDNGVTVRVAKVSCYFSAFGTTEEEAKNNIQKVYYFTEQIDYLKTLKLAHDNRVKRKFVASLEVDLSKVYKTCACTDVLTNIDKAQILSAKANKEFAPNKVNVWHFSKGLQQYYI